MPTKFYSLFVFIIHHHHFMKHSKLNYFPEIIMFKNWSNLLSLKIFCFIQIFSLVISFSSIAADQCMLLPITVQKRTQEASLIVEAEVLSSQSFWTKNHDMIYTIHHLKIYKLFKGNPSLTEFDILTEGGTKNHALSLVSDR